MRRFSTTHAANNFTGYIICRGDEFGLCDNCKVKFKCYTGSVDGDWHVPYGKDSWLDGLEQHIFGYNNNMIDYDYETHDKVFKFHCIRSKSRFKKKQQRSIS